MNTYDNTIDYTSQNIARVVDAARTRTSSVDIAVMYLSDHGESLGERNIYLHGLPTMLAPIEQTHVPMLTWFSDEAQERLNVPRACLASVTQDTFSHDNLFSTLLGFFNVVTTAYRPELDVLAAARKSLACTASQKGLTLK